MLMMESRGATIRRAGRPLPNILTTSHQIGAVEPEKTIRSIELKTTVRLAHMPYFHELDALQFNAMKALSMTWGEVKSNYEEPPWCGAGREALDPMGCWSLVGRRIRCRADCDGCDLVKP